MVARLLFLFSGKSAYWTGWVCSFKVSRMACMTKRNRMEDMLSPWWTPMVLSTSVNLVRALIFTVQLLYNFRTICTRDGGRPYWMGFGKVDRDERCQKLSLNQ